MTRRVVFALCVLAVGAGAARVARADSSLGGAFILPGYGARAWGMAGAVAARIDDESAVDWNPAGISRARRSAGLAYVELVPEAFVNQAQASFVMPFGPPPDTETGVSHHAAGAMFTNLSADLGAGLTYQENHLRVAYAWSPQPLASFGFAGSVFFSQTDVANFDGWGTAFDLAGRLSLSRNWTFALVGRDVFSRYSYDDDRDYKKETQYVVGLSRQNFYGIDLETDVVYVHEGWHRALLGAETHYLFGYVALRGGVGLWSAGDARATYSFGASARALDRLFVHYGAQIDDEDAFGTMHRFSLAVRL